MIAVWEMDTVGAAVEEAEVVGETGVPTVAVHPIAASETGDIASLVATLAVDRVPAVVVGIVVIGTVDGRTMIAGGMTMIGVGAPLVAIAARVGAAPVSATV